MPHRGTFAYKLRRALSHPHRLLPALYRTLKNMFLNATSADQIIAHRRFIEDYGSNDPNLAMGSQTEEHWLTAGKNQFNYLVEHGLKPSQRVLEVGCGNLRLGWRLIEYLDPCCYVGLEISPKMLAHARRKIPKFKLQRKLPYLFHVEELDYSFFPERSFDWISAYAVFVNSSIESIERVILALAPLLKEGGNFDFTYYETKGSTYCFQGVYYFHNRSQVAAIVEKTDLRAVWLGESWDAQQMRVRLTRPPA